MRNLVLLITITCLAILSLGAAVVADDYVIPAGSEVTIAFDQDVSSKYVRPGDLVPIRLVEPIEVAGTIVVKDGVPGTARVKSVQAAGKPGKPGRVEVELLELTADGSFKSIDNKNIQISREDGEIVAEGKGKKTLSWLFIFGLFIKGGEGVIAADQPFSAQVTADVLVEVQ